MNALEVLQKFTTVVADTADIDLIRKFALPEATTNPSLVLKAVSTPVGKALLHTIVADYATEPLAHQCDRLVVALGVEIARLISGRISTEVDSRLSFDTPKTVERAHFLVDLYEKSGVPRDRVLIKIAATWEGILASKQLEKEGVHCNLTLIFSMVQAVCCAQAGVTLVSPFVGRVYDWFCGRDQKEFFSTDPGVALVKSIYSYFKKHDYATQVMGASFRKVSQVLSLTGCDFLTVSPQILEQLMDTTGQNVQELTNQMEDPFISDSSLGLGLEAITRSNQVNLSLSFQEESFRWLLNQDAMATEKLAEGIRLFSEDTMRLSSLIKDLYQH